MLLTLCGCPDKNGSAETDPVSLQESGDLLRPIAPPDFSLVNPEIRRQIEDLATAVERGARGRHNASDRAAAFGNYGRASLAAEFTPTAEACFLNASALQPQEFEWPYLLGHLYRGDNRLELSIVAFRRATTLDPESVPAWAWLGRTLYEGGKPEDAGRAFEQLLRVQPGSAIASLHLGKIALDRRDYEQAYSERRQEFEAFCQLYGIHVMPMSTQDDPVSALQIALGRRTH